MLFRLSSPVKELKGILLDGDEKDKNYIFIIFGV